MRGTSFQRKMLIEDSSSLEKNNSYVFILSNGKTGAVYLTSNLTLSDLEAPIGTG